MFLHRYRCGAPQEVVSWHVPLMQECPDGHCLPQPPQLFLSLPPVVVQLPPQHDWPEPHFLPHEPQLFLSVF